jgi:hypothetical protein
MTDEVALAIIVERRGSMYDPEVVDALVGLDPSVRLAESLAGVEYSLVLEQLRSSPSDGRQVADGEPRAAQTLADPGPAGRPTAFVADGTGAPHHSRSLLDVLQRSTHRVRAIVPEATGAWFIVHPAGGHVEAVEPFGPAAHVLIGRRIQMGDKLSGWVAAYRQQIVNSDAALDLGDGAGASAPALGFCLSLPMVEAGTLAAVLSLYSRAPQRFTADQIRQLQVAAPHIANAILAAA